MSSANVDIKNLEKNIWFKKVLNLTSSVLNNVVQEKSVTTSANHFLMGCHSKRDDDPIDLIVF